MNVDQLGIVLLAGAAVLLVAVVAVRWTTSSGLPSLLLYLGLGLLIGEKGIGLRFDDAELTGVLGYCALILILAEGGLTTRWDQIRPSAAAAGVLATVGICVSVGVVAVAARLLLGLDWPLALLVGAVVSSTDAAAVFSVLRQVPLPGRLSGLLEAESGFNDAPVVIAVVALTEFAGSGSAHPWWALVGEAVLELVAGAGVGLALGRVGAWVLARLALPASGLYPLAVLGLAFAAFGAATCLQGSGFLATYLCTLVLGNVRLPHGAAVRSFAEGLGWLAQIGLFVLLGLLANPARLPALVLPAVAIGLVLLLAARPLSVLVSLVPFRFPLREQAFLSWAGLRGAVPIVLTTIPMAAHVPGSTRLFDLVFVLVAVFTLLQGPTLPFVARRLGIGVDLPTTTLDVESSPLGALAADVIYVRVGPGSRLHGVEIFELRLPDRANITLVIRNGRAFVPQQRTMLRHGDDLIVVTAAAVRDQAERRLHEVSAGGKLADWRTPSRYPRKSPRQPGESPRQPGESPQGV